MRCPQCRIKYIPSVPSEIPICYSSCLYGPYSYLQTEYSGYSQGEMGLFGSIPHGYRSRCILLCSHISLIPGRKIVDQRRSSLALTCASLGKRGHGQKSWGFLVCFVLCCFCLRALFCCASLTVCQNFSTVHLDLHKDSLICGSQSKTACSRGSQTGTDRLELLYRPLQGPQLGSRSICLLPIVHIDETPTGSLDKCAGFHCSLYQAPILPQKLGEKDAIYPPS